MKTKQTNDIVLPKEIKQQLAVIDQSQWYILVIIAAVALSYYATSIQRQKLVCSVTNEECCKCLPDTFPIRSLSSIMIIVALFFFFGLSKETLCQPQCDPVKHTSSQFNYIASLLVLVAALIRFYDLNFVNAHTPKVQPC